MITASQSTVIVSITDPQLIAEHLDRGLTAACCQRCSTDGGTARATAPLVLHAVCDPIRGRVHNAVVLLCRRCSRPDRAEPFILEHLQAYEDAIGQARRSRQRLGPAMHTTLIRAILDQANETRTDNPHGRA